MAWTTCTNGSPSRVSIPCCRCLFGIRRWPRQLRRRLPGRVYDWGDTLQLSGRVATLAGSPLVATRLTYRWIRTPRGREEVWEDGETVASGQLQTDAAGTFRVPVTFTRPAWERRTSTSSPEYLYRLSVDVVAEQGERQTASLSVPVGGASLRLHWLQGRSKLARQRLDSCRSG